MPLLSGKILNYRVFDIGADVDLEKFQRSLFSATTQQRFRLSKFSRAMIINNAPLALTFESGRHMCMGLLLDYDIAAKVWHFGAISVNIQFNIPENLTWNQLVELGALLENDEAVQQMAVQKVTQMLQQFDQNRLQNLKWTTFEDYTMYFFKSLPGAEKNALNVFQQYDVHRLILSESQEILSEQVKKSVSDGAIQYSESDLAVINWNSALIIEPSGSFDIPDVIEFALCQLLEMRYYDDVLDERLASLYSTLEGKGLSIWETYSERMSREAARKYLEISDTIESVENSLKVVGDFYLAQVFRAASSRLRFNDWKDSVDQKLNNLAQIAKLMTNELNERRSRLLEMIIIVLIAIELIPFVAKLF